LWTSPACDNILLTAAQRNRPAGEPGFPMISTLAGWWVRFALTEGQPTSHRGHLRGQSPLLRADLTAALKRLRKKSLRQPTTTTGAEARIDLTPLTRPSKGRSSTVVPDSCLFPHPVKAGRIHVSAARIGWRRTDAVSHRPFAPLLGSSARFGGLLELRWHRKSPPHGTFVSLRTCWEGADRSVRSTSNGRAEMPAPHGLGVGLQGREQGPKVGVVAEGLAQVHE
jgi:hypothetical protein